MDPALLLGLGALAIGPLLAEGLARVAAARAMVESFLVVVVVGLVLIHILPAAVGIGGLGALVAAGVGLVVPMLLHRKLHSDHDAHDHDSGSEVNAAFVFALNALAAHAVLDGVSLTGWRLDEPGAVALVAAVLLHRIPIGMAIWWLGRPRIGLIATVGVLALMGLATWVGYALVPGGLGAASGAVLGWFEALMAGSLLHVALEHGPPPEAGGRASAPVGVGLGALVLVAMTLLEEGTGDDSMRVIAEMGAVAVIAIWVAVRRRQPR